MKEILIIINDQTYCANLSDSLTAQQLWDALPLEGSANIWGEEIYFKISLAAEQEPDAQEEVEPGTITYWPTGQAFCIFFGPTPVSTGEKPPAYSPVNILGRIEGQLDGLRDVQQGDVVRLQKAAV